MTYTFSDATDIEGLYVDAGAKSYFVCDAIRGSDTLNVDRFDLTTHEKVSTFRAKGRVLLGHSGGDLARALVSATVGAPDISLHLKVDAYWSARDGGWQKGSIVCAPGGYGKWVRHN